MSHGHADGHEKEPHTFFGGRSDGGRGLPDIHSHHKGRKRKLAGTSHTFRGKRVGMKIHGKGK